MDKAKENMRPYYVGVPEIQGGSNMTGTDLCVNKPHCAAALSRSHSFCAVRLVYTQISPGHI